MRPPSALLTRRWGSWFSLPIFAAATLASWSAQAWDRPVSAALLYLLGVLLIGATSGVKLGLAAAIGASLIHNFFLVEPKLQFRLDSADEFIPLLALNLCAIVSGVLAGRLQDRARAAEHASARLDQLLGLSRALQEAVTLEELGSALSRFCQTTGIGTAELWALEDGRLVAASGDETARAIPPNHEGGDTSDGLSGSELKRLATPRGACGVLLHHRDDAAIVDWESVAALLSIAVERCLLVRSLADAEALRRSEEFKTTLISSVSHDLRTPLAAITASATSLLSFEEGLSRPDRQTMLQIIRDQADRLNRYTSNLLSLNRLQSAVDPRELDSVDLVDLVGTVLSSIRSRAVDHRFEKTIGLSQATVRANPVMIEQALGNVVENAVRYSPDGSLIRVELAMDGRDYLILVEDEGDGVDPAELERIFERFYRGGRPAGEEGQGLGLSISKGFVERFGGTISAFSPVRSGRGTRIEIRLPIPIPCEEAVA